MTENKNQVQKSSQKEQVQNALSVIRKDIADIVFDRVKQLESTGQLIIPKNYAIGNALKAAYLTIQEVKDKNGRPALEVCTKESIALALLNMVIQGLNPIKDQCYFIVYGNKLYMFRSYLGDIVAIKNAFPNHDVNVYASIIYEGDTVKVKKDPITWRDRIVSHETEFENRDNPIRGAYATLVIDGELIDQELMSWKEIQSSWSHAKTQNTHKEFPQQMAGKTVIRRLANRYIRTSDDANLVVVESYMQTTKDEYDFEPDTPELLQEEVDTIANQEPLVIEHEPEPEPETPTAVEQPNFDDELGF